MNTNNLCLWQRPNAQQLARVLTELNDLSTMQAFLRDVMTEPEIIEISSRLQAAKLLEQGKKYTEIVATTKLSSRTIARIKDWMQNGCGGYTTVLKQLNAHHDHTSPVRAA